MKKCFAWILMVSLLLTCAAAFAEAPVYPAAVPAAPVFAWECDLSTHWQLDGNGQPVNAAEHTLDEMDFCTVCGGEVWDYGDDSGCVSLYDEQGNLLHYVGIEEGVITYDSRHILTYDENGVLVQDLEFIGGVLYGEYVYAVDEEGSQIPVQQSFWNDDGTSSVNEYDQYGNCVRSASYEADGSLSAETLTEYALADDGWYYECKVLNRFPEGATLYSEYNQYGDEIRTINTHEDGTVWLNTLTMYEYVDGVKAWARTYDCVLVAESFYDEDGCNTKDIEYLEDGACIVYTYDENGDATEAHYDAAGNPVE